MIDINYKLCPICGSSLSDCFYYDTARKRCGSHFYIYFYKNYPESIHAMLEEHFFAFFYLEEEIAYYTDEFGKDYVIGKEGDFFDLINIYLGRNINISKINLILSNRKYKSIIENILKCKL